MPKIWIYRGLPGSGKSYQIQKAFPNIGSHLMGAQSFPNKINYSPYLSTDLYWYIDSKFYTYDYRPAEIGKAHAWNFKCYQTVLETSDVHKWPDIVVDNTNISAYELAPYLLAASACCFEHEIITVWADPVVCIKRNVHSVPANVIMGMYQRLLTETLPSFWKHTIICPE